MSERMERQTGESSSSAVKVSKLVKRYGDMLALDYFDLDVHQGEIFGLLDRTVPARPRRLTAFSHC